MCEKTELLSYMTAMYIAKKWLAGGIITEKDYLKIDTITAKKFGISDISIWRHHDLITPPSYGNMSTTKGGEANGTDCSAGSQNETV